MLHIKRVFIGLILTLLSVGGVSAQNYGGNIAQNLGIDEFRAGVLFHSFDEPRYGDYWTLDEPVAIAGC